MSNQYSLLIINGEAIGRLHETGVDNYWIYGRFYPLPPFDKYKELFQKLENAWKSSAENDLLDEELINKSENAYEIQDQINILDIVVKTESGAINRVRDFKIEKENFEYKIDW